MSIERFMIRPGERLLIPENEPNTLLFYNGVPDDVRLPPELGGEVVKVKRSFEMKCPCNSGHQAITLELDEPTGIHVAECSARGFLWFRFPK